MKTRNLIAASLLASVALPPAGPALAQGLALEEIVVTARKRDESILEVPVSVTALSQEMLDRAGIDNPQDLSALVPGLDYRSFDFGGYNNPNIRIRGMIQQIITPSTQIGALFWDGSYIGAGGGFLPLGDLERVEVIKGPQTAYFGRNTFSGAVNYIPAMPGDEWNGKVSASWSPTDHDEININGAVGGPVSSRVGVRVWAGYDKDGGDFSYRDGTPFAQLKTSSVSGTITYEPTEDLRLKTTGYYTRATDTATGSSLRHTTPAGACGFIFRGELLNAATGERTPHEFDLSTLGVGTFCGEFPDGSTLEFPVTSTPTAAQLLNGANGEASLTALNPRSLDYGIIRAPQGRLGGWHQTYRLQASADYDFAGHTLTVLGSRGATGTTTRLDQFFGVSSVGDRILVVGTEIALREFYYEARVSSPQDQRFRYLLGVSDYNQHYSVFTDSARPSPVDRQRNTTFAVFGSFDYDILDNLTLSAEVRYTDEQSTAIEFGDPRLPCGDVTICNQTNSYDDIIPRVILSYKPVDGTTLYGSYSYSSLLGLATQARFISSLAPDIIPPGEVDAIGDFTAPQENTQYELGWKQQWDDWNMTLAMFYMDWKNQPFAAVIFLPGGAGTSSFRGPGDSSYSGFDLEINGNVTDWLNIAATVAYSNGVMDSFSSRGSNEQVALGSGSLSVVADGNPVRNHPEWTGSLSPTITGTLGDRPWFVRGDYLYTGRHYVDYSRYNQNPARKQVNLRAGIEVSDGLMFEAFGTNIFNDKTLPTTSGTTSGPGGSRKVFTGVYQALEYGIRVSAKF